MTLLKVKHSVGQQQQQEVPNGRWKVASGRWQRQVANCRCLSTDTKLIKGMCATFEI